MSKTRTVRFELRLTEKEYEAIRKRAAMTAASTISAFIRKMALNGYIIQFEFPELRELTMQMKRIGSNVNQIARRVNANDRIYQEDLREINARQEELLQALRAIIQKLGTLG